MRRLKPSSARTRQNVVVDASVLFSAVLRPGSVPDQSLQIARTQFRLALSDAVLAEVSDVFGRRYLRGKIDAKEIQAFVQQLAARARRIAPGRAVVECRDPSDNKYLELALAADAVAIVTGDRDLLELDPWRGIRIVTPAQFLALAAEREAGT